MYDTSPNSGLYGSSVLVILLLSNPTRTPTACTVIFDSLFSGMLSKKSVNLCFFHFNRACRLDHPLPYLGETLILRGRLFLVIVKSYYLKKSRENWSFLWGTHRGYSFLLFD
jgi:hypothetical protein